MSKDKVFSKSLMKIFEEALIEIWYWKELPPLKKTLNQTI